MRLTPALLSVLLAASALSAGEPAPAVPNRPVTDPVIGNGTVTAPSSGATVTERTVIVERDPILGARLPENVIYETKKSWKFEDDMLEFRSENRNPDGKRYVIWNDYHFVIGANEITVLDPRPFGTTLTASRSTTDKKGRTLTDKKLMDSLKDEAGDLRRAREPIAPPPPVHVGIGFGWGGYYGPRYYHGHHHHYRPAYPGYIHRGRR